MEAMAMGVHSANAIFPISAVSLRGRSLFTNSRAAQKSSARVAAAARRGTTVFPIGEPGPREFNTSKSQPIKLLTNVEKLRLLSKAERAGLLSAAEDLGLSLSTVERLGLLSKAEELGVLSAATDPNTPSSLFGLSLILLALGPVCVYVVPDQDPLQIGLQVVVALVSVVGGPVALAASSFVSRLQKSS